MRKQGKRLFAKIGSSTPLDQQIYAYLTEKISQGAFSGGDRLVEADLQKIFKVSRNPIREAMRFLTSRGLLETVPGRGASMRRVSFKDIKEIYPILANLLGLAASMAADHIEEPTWTEGNTWETSPWLKAAEASRTSPDIISVRARSRAR